MRFVDSELHYMEDVHSVSNHLNKSAWEAVWKFSVYSWASF